MLSLLFVARDAPMFQADPFEIFQLSWFAILFIHSMKTRGKWITLQIFLIGMIYGLVLENGGPMQIPFLGLSGYFYEDNWNLYLFEFFGYGIRLSLVPLVTHLGWCNVFYVSVFFWEKILVLWPQLKSRPFICGLIFSISGLLHDMQMDVVATRFNWWVWNENLSQFFFGVPLVNYIAWFCAVYWFGVLWAYAYSPEFLIKQKLPTAPSTPAEKELIEKRRTKFITLSVPFLWVIDLIMFLIIFNVSALLGWIYV